MYIVYNNFGRIVNSRTVWPVERRNEVSLCHANLLRAERPVACRMASRWSSARKAKPAQDFSPAVVEFPSCAVQAQKIDCRDFCERIARTGFGGAALTAFYREEGRVRPILPLVAALLG